MERLGEFLLKHNVKVEEDVVTAITLNDATIYCYFDENGAVKIEIEPHDKKINVDVNLEDAIGINPYKNN